jgi:hypothetical protein
MSGPLFCEHVEVRQRQRGQRQADDGGRQDVENFGFHGVGPLVGGQASRLAGLISQWPSGNGFRCRTYGTVPYL